MGDKTRSFTDANWEADVLASPEPVMVDFWAEWCAPCKLLARTVDELAFEFDGHARVGKLNVDENAAVSDRYGIRGIPTVIVFKDGEVREQVVGVTSKENLTRLLEKHVNRGQESNE